MDHYVATPLVGIRSYHAEGPVYDDLTGELLWVDTYAGEISVAKLRRGDGWAYAERTVHAIGEYVGAVVPAADPADGWVVAGRYGFARLGRDGRYRPLQEPERGAEPPTRMNDGTCDPAGRFWAGSMGLAAEPGAGRLHRLDPDGGCSELLTGVTISNGMAWADRHTAYYIDTPTGRVDRLRLADDGSILARDPAFEVDGGSPDGMTIDAAGRLWVALWGGSGVACFTPEGDLVARIEVAAMQTSSCAFGGPDLSTLFITTSQEKYTAEQSAAEPWSGSVFAVDLPTPGLPVDRFGQADFGQGDLGQGDLGQGDLGLGGSAR